MEPSAPAVNGAVFTADGPVLTKECLFDTGRNETLVRKQEGRQFMVDALAAGAPQPPDQEKYLSPIRQKGDPLSASIGVHFRTAGRTGWVDLSTLDGKQAIPCSSSQYRFVIIIFITSSPFVKKQNWPPFLPWQPVLLCGAMEVPFN